VTNLIVSLLLVREKAEETSHKDSEKGKKTGQMTGWKTKKFVKGR
jgi:hypothetical protein